jgi:hypothetical protein
MLSSGPMAVSRPQAFLPDPDDNFDENDTPVQAYLTALADDGMSVLNATIHDLDLDRLRNDPDFVKAEQQAMARFQRKFARDALDKAMNGVFEDVFHQGVLVGQKRKHDTTLHIRVLETLVPGFQKVDKKEITTKTEISEREVKAIEQMTPEQFAELKALMDKVPIDED